MVELYAYGIELYTCVDTYKLYLGMISQNYKLLELVV